jgi:hypothetical protein
LRVYIPCFVTKGAWLRAPASSTTSTSRGSSSSRSEPPKQSRCRAIVAVVSDKGVLILVGLLFVGIGIVFGALAWFFLARTRRFLRTAVDATGTIIDLVESSGSEGGTTYSAVVRFQTADGREIQWTESMASNPPAGKRGDQLLMKYDPANPQSARIAKTSRLWFMPMLFGGLGALFFAIGVVLAVVGAGQ